MPSTELITGSDQRFAEVLRLTAPSMRRYAAAHGMRFLSVPMGGHGRAASWSKIRALQEALDRGADPAIWIDADALMVRFDQDIRSTLDPAKDFFVFWQDRFSDPYANLGVIVVRNTEWSRQFLQQIWDAKLDPEHGWWDQAAFQHLIGMRRCLERGEVDAPDENLLAHIGALDERWNVILSYSDIDNARIRHYAGMALSTKLAMIRFDLALPEFCRDRGIMALSRADHWLKKFVRRMEAKALSAGPLKAHYYGIRKGFARRLRAAIFSRSR
jgi:hypothetical protein